MFDLSKTPIGRRAFTKRVSSLTLMSLLSPSLASLIAHPSKLKYEAQLLTSGPLNHFFGYYGICPWNKKESHILSLETTFIDRLPKKGEAAAIGLVDVNTGNFEQLTSTLAWNMQQGAMMHWHPKFPNQKIIYNDINEGKLCSVIYDISTGTKDFLPHPVSGLDKQGDNGLFISYGRTGRLRKVVGYEGMADPFPNDPHPADDGVFIMDLATGKSKLIVSIDQVYELLKDRHPELKDTPMWFNHTEFNPSGNRFFFLARTWNDQKQLESGMFSVNIDGSDLVETIPYGKSVSHFGWRNDKEIVATFVGENNPRRSHYIFTDGTGNYEEIAPKSLIDDGHCTVSPNGNLLATDRNHFNELTKSLWLYNFADGSAEQLGNYPMREKKYLISDVRCDLHPRWNHSGNKICIDILNPKDWTRQISIVHLSL